MFPSATRCLHPLHARLAWANSSKVQDCLWLAVMRYTHSSPNIWCQHAGHPKLTRSLNMWLHAAADQGNVKAAAAALEDLQARGAAPNLASFNALFRVSASLGDNLTC